MTSDGLFGIRNRKVPGAVVRNAGLVLATATLLCLPLSAQDPPTTQDPPTQSELEKMHAEIVSLLRRIAAHEAENARLRELVAEPA